MPDSRKTPDLVREQGWQAALERDRLAATIMAPSRPFPGPGAAAGPMAGKAEAAKELAGGVLGELSGEGAKMGTLKKLRLAWKLAPLPVKMTVIAALAKFFVTVVIPGVAILAIVVCMADKSCFASVGKSVGLDFISDIFN